MVDVETLLPWAPAAAAGAHVVEEFVFPGGFSAWYKEYRPDAAVSFTRSFAVKVNALLLGLCLLLPVLGPSDEGVALWLTLAALLVANAGFHLRGALRSRRYSPGVVTATLLYVPMGVFGYWYYLGHGQASAGTAVSAAVLGGSYNFVSAWLHHRRAARAS